MQRPNSYRVQSRDAERYFPVRIRVEHGQVSRDRQYDQMRRWLDANIGVGRWWNTAERLNSVPDTMLFYFVVVSDAQAFIDRFSCGVYIVGEWPHSGKPMREETDLSWIGELHGTQRTRRD
jgi:hypothetical protein